MLGRVPARAVLAGAVAVAGLLAGTPAASAEDTACRIVWDPRWVFTPAGPVSVPYPYLRCD